jgi:hypothetical protein
MACLDLPAIPNLSIGLPSIPRVPLPLGLGGDFCCKFEVALKLTPSQQAAVDAAIKSATASMASILGPLVVVNQTIKTLNDEIDDIKSKFPKCPLED